MWRKGDFLHCWWKYKLMQPLWKIVWRFLKELKIELPYDTGILSRVYAWKRLKPLSIIIVFVTVIWDHLSSMFILQLFEGGHNHANIRW